MKKLLLLALCALLAANAGARTLYVDASRPNNSGNGLSRAKAKKTIQAAINVAQAGDTILVYPGKYAPIKANNKKIVIKSVSGAAKTMIVKPKVSAGTIALAQLGKSWKYTYVSTGGSAGEVKGRTYTASSYPISDGKKTTLAGFLLDGLYRGGDYVVGVSGGTVKSCTIQRIGGESDGVPGCAAVYASLTGCKIQSNRYVGSAFGIVSDCTLHRCKITKNRGW